MAVFYKAALSGTYQGQSIVNILYYGDDAGDPVSVWSELEAQDVGEGVLASVVPDYLLSLPATYTLNSIIVSGINERGVTVSDYEVEVAVEDPGGVAVNSEGQAQVAIIAFRTVKHNVAGRNIKRSYLAYGPLTDSAQASDGSLEAAFATAIADLLIALASPVTGTLAEWAPVRVGRTVAPDPVAVGRVNGINLRPFASFRKSRKRRPSGL